jgi:hypothetical protein
LDKYEKSLGLDQKDKTPLIAQVVYGCSTGYGWIVNFGHTKTPRLVDEIIIKRVVHMHGQGEPKWFLSFTKWSWHHVCGWLLTCAHAMLTN